MVTINENPQTLTGRQEAAKVRRRGAVAPAEPCGGVQPPSLDGSGGRDTGGGALVLEVGDLWRHGGHDDAFVQLTSSASMQVAPRPLPRDNHSHMSTAAQIRDWLKSTLAETGITVKDWARKSGVAPSTIHRALKDDYQFLTSNRTLSKLATAAGVAPPDSPSIEVQMVGAEALPIRYEVGAGNWQEISDSQVFYGSGTVAPDPAYAGFPQWLERVSGDSMDREYRDGELIHVVDAFALGYAPQHGDHVVLVRRRNNGAEMERTVKEVVRTQAGAFEFWPRSSNPRWREPVRLVDGVEEDPSIEIEVAALVIGSYRPRRR